MPCVRLDTRDQVTSVAEWGQSAALRDTSKPRHSSGALAPKGGLLQLELTAVGTDHAAAAAL